MIKKLCSRPVVLEQLESRLALSASAFGARIDFQPATSAVTKGYVSDVGAVIGLHKSGLNYGWSADVSANAVDRHNAAAGKYGTFITMPTGAEWEIFVPNGTYTVNIAVGDPQAVNSTYALKLNGKAFLNGTPTRKQHILQATQTVTVSNRRLIVSNGSGAVNSKIDSINIVKAKTAVAVKSTTSNTINPIQAHGGDIIYLNGVYYWYGENKDAPTTIQKTIGKPRANVVGISVYESLDLHTWDYRGLALPGTPTGDLAPGNVLERPKVLYNAKTRKFVMWMHVDNATYTDSRVGVAVSNTPAGPFTYVGSFNPLGVSSRDMTVFQDTDGSAYLVFATNKNKQIRIAQMTSNYLALNGRSAVPFTNAGLREAPQLIKQSGKYYLITSGATWFDPNAAQYAVSSSVLGKYTKMGNPISGSGASTTFNSQGADAFQDVATGKYYLLADRWNQSNLGASTYVFMPLTFSGSKLTIGTPLDWDLKLYA